MISRLVTIDLLVSAVTRTRGQLPGSEWKESIELFNTLLKTFNCWAHKIESQGASVSLDCIFENVLWLKTQQQYFNADFEELGLKLIADASYLDSLLGMGRATQNVPRPDMEKMEKALESSDKVSFYEAARITTVLKNPTEAAESFRNFLDWCIHEWSTADLLSPNVKGFIERVLSKKRASKKSDFPRGLATELCCHYQDFRVLRPKHGTSNRVAKTSSST